MPTIPSYPAQTVPNNSDQLVIQDSVDAVTKHITRSDFLSGAPLPSGTTLPSGSVTNAMLSTSSGEVGASWLSYTPTFTGLTVGNGTLTAKYSKIGKRITVRLNFIFGSTSSVSGDVILSLPVTAASYAGTANVTQIGGANLFDTSQPRVYQGLINMASTTTATVRLQAADATYLYSLVMSSTTPFTWAIGDEIGTTFTYESA